jgi:hypothetical protein
MAAHVQRRAAPSWCGELPGGRASAAAAVRPRAKASGRSVVRRAPRGRIAPAFRCARQLSRRVAGARLKPKLRRRVA